MWPKKFKLKTTIIVCQRVIPVDRYTANEKKTVKSLHYHKLIFLNGSFCCINWFACQVNPGSVFSLITLSYYILTKLAHAFPYYGHSRLQCMTCMESYHFMVFLSLVCYHTFQRNFLWLSFFHRSSYMAFSDSQDKCMEVNQDAMARTHETFIALGITLTRFDPY